MSDVDDDEFGTEELTAGQIILELQKAGLIEHVGRQLSPAEDDGTTRAAGMMSCYSAWTGDQIHAYELHAAAWEADDPASPERDVVVDHFAADFDEWDRLLFVIRGRKWSVACVTGPPDASIPPDLRQRVQAELGGRLVTEKPVPEPREPHRAFATASALVDRLCNVGLIVEKVAPDELVALLARSPDMREWLDDDEYAALRLRSSLDSATSWLIEIIIEDRWASAMSQIASSMLNLADDDDWATCAGEGWSITVHPDKLASYPPALRAAELMGALGGSAVTASPRTPSTHSDQATVDAFAWFGRLPSLNEDAIAALDASFANDEFADPRLLVTSWGVGHESLGVWARQASSFWSEARRTAQESPSRAPGPDAAENAARRVCWAVLSLTLLADQAPRPARELLEPAGRMTLLDDVRSFEKAVGGRLTSVRRLRRLLDFGD